MSLACREDHDRVAVLRFDDPGRRNVLSPRMVADLVATATTVGERAARADPALARTVEQTLGEAGRTPDLARTVDVEFGRQVWSLHEPAFQQGLERARNVGRS